MGGKDTPPPCVSASPVQNQKFWDKSRSFSVSSTSTTSSSASSASLSSNSQQQPAPFRYVPPSKTHVNLQIQCPSITSPDRDSGGSKADEAYSPIRAYIDCLSPQTLKCAIVGDSGVGKTSLLMSYVVDKFPEAHSPTIYDKISSKKSSFL